MADKIIRIGGASGFWGDAACATPQLLAAGGLDFIVYDYLAEITMSIMARARAKDPEKGYALDFVSAAMKPNLAEIASQGVRIIANAGGVNPQACSAALRAVVAELGLNLKVACVLGDDLIEQREQLATRTTQEMFSGESFPAADRVQSINAYLGAFPVAKALDLGADIIVTGRGVDSAVTLGACIHAYGWTRDDYDKLAMGSLAGHILECGPQATGGNFTDWEAVDRIDEIGYPIAELSADGSFTCTKPEGTGGIVTVGTVTEQMVYEIGDPQAYILPDVVCDFSQVELKQAGTDSVSVAGAKGRPAPDTYKVCATHTDQFRGGTYMTFYGIDADKKALALAEAVFKASRRVFEAYNLPDFSETSVELIGAESQYGAHRKISGSREVAAKVAVKHPDMMGIGIMLKEAVGLGLATPPGLSGFQGGRPKPSPVVRLFSFVLPKDQVSVQIEMDDDTVECNEAHGEAFNTASIDRPVQPTALESQDLVEVPLIALAWGRSGDKGNKANVGIISREPEYLPYIYATLTEQVVADRFAHFLEDLENSVERFLMPGSNAINFLLHNVLGGGGVASIRNDAQGKGYAQLLLDVPIPVPQKLAEHSTRGASK
ncbi:MAG: acyclic terpene utilization AtuA family protein [Pseudomonadales bacterium]